MKKNFKCLLLVFLCLTISGCCSWFGTCKNNSIKEQEAYAVVSNKKLELDHAMVLAKNNYVIYDDNGKLTKDGQALFGLYSDAFAKGHTFINCLENQQSSVLNSTAQDYINSVNAFTKASKLPSFGIAAVDLSGLIQGLVNGGITIWKAINDANEIERAAKIEEQKKLLEGMRPAPWEAFFKQKKES